MICYAPTESAAAMPPVSYGLDGQSSGWIKFQVPVAGTIGPRRLCVFGGEPNSRRDCRGCVVVGDVCLKGLRCHRSFFISEFHVSIAMMYPM